MIKTKFSGKNRNIILKNKFMILKFLVAFLLSKIFLTEFVTLIQPYETC